MDTRHTPWQDSTATVAQVTVYAKPASGTGSVLLTAGDPGAMQQGSERREHYTARGQQPSFAFADIDDEEVLAVEAGLRQATQSTQHVQPASPRQTEEARRLSETAAAIKKMMEGEVASVLKRLARIPAQQGAGEGALQEAKTCFSLFIKHFQQAKLAAGDGRQDLMKAALTAALATLARFAGQHVDSSILPSRAFRIEVQPSLQALAAACSTWADVADPLSGRPDPGVRGSADKHDTAGTDARTRSVSSPAPVRPPEERERATSVHGQNSPSGLAPSSNAVAGPATADRPAKLRSPSSPGKKLKAFFSRSSEARSPRARADSEPGSPPSRPATKRGKETGSTTVPDAKNTASTATTSTQVIIAARAERKPDAAE